jgi:hypothetical protein
MAAVRDGNDQIWEFWRVLMRTLKRVKVVYPEAKFDLSTGG